MPLSPLPPVPWGRLSTHPRVVANQNAALPAVRPVSGKLGPYELVCELASGGMGALYVATRTHEGGIQRTLAIKTIHPHLAQDERFVRMFLSEARIVSRISHSYVCRLTDVGCEAMILSRGGDVGARANVPYVAMEYLVGEPLSRILPFLPHRSSDLSTACVVKMTAQMCEGLHAAHEATDEEDRPLRVVHRDVSPDNLFLLYDGTVRLVDFGIARAEDTARTTKTGSGPKGKFAYMSPEQLRCEAVDRRSDIWSMGVVLWELLAGKALMPRSSDLATSRAVLESVIPPPSAHNPIIPKPLDEITMKALERDPERRYQTAIDFGNALEQFAARCYGTTSSAALGRWLEGMLPGGKEFRQSIVRRARTALQVSSAPLPLPVPSSEATTSPVVRRPKTTGIRVSKRTATATVVMLFVALVGAAAVTIRLTRLQAAYQQNAAEKAINVSQADTE